MCNTCNSRIWSKQDPEKFRATRRKAQKRLRTANIQRTRESLNVYRTSMPWEQRVLTNRNDARKQRRENLPIEFLRNLREKTPDCPCCGKVLIYDSLPRSSPRNDMATLDKIIPELGYITTNVAIICHWCNSRKRDLTIDDLEMITNYIKSKLKDSNGFNRSDIT